MSNSDARRSVKIADVPPGERIVISGMAGKFPNSNNVLEFQENILNKVELTSEDDRRWKSSEISLNIPKRFGKLYDIEKFDSSIFCIPYKHSDTADPLLRLVLEKSWEAVVDAGYNPKKLRGSKTGVFIALCLSETEVKHVYDEAQNNSLGLVAMKACITSYISYHLGLNGPSFSVDTACSSSAYAVDFAYNSIREGRCDAAIVGTVNLILNPYSTLGFSNLGVLSSDGRCKVFDEAGNGYCRSEAVSAVFLQKAQDAKRIYCTIVHIKTNCDGFKEQGITFPSADMQEQLLKELYEECDVDPCSVGWVEAHGTGTKVGDPEECKVIKNIFCKGRKGPVLVGSVKSNIGHSEPASCISSIVKAIISMETEIIPPNMYFKTPRLDIEGLQEGLLSVVTEKTPWNGTTVGISSFGFGGANAHMLLKWNEKKKLGNKNESLDILPLIIGASGRIGKSVETMLASVEKFSFDKEHIKLLHDIYEEDIPGHFYRGYLYHDFLTGNSVKHVKYLEETNREVMFVFRELQTEDFPVITNLLIQLPGFASVIQRCHSALAPYGIDLSTELKGFGKNNLPRSSVVLHVSVASIQIGLLEVLKSMGIIPSTTLGFSAGELIAAYADGVLSLEQTILATYFCCVFGTYSDSDKCQSIVSPDCNKKIDTDMCLSNAKQQKMITVQTMNNHNSLNGVSEESSLDEKLLNCLRKIIPKPKKFSSNHLNCKEPWVNNHIGSICSAEYIKNSWRQSKPWDKIVKNFKKKCIIVDFSYCARYWNEDKINNSFMAYIPLFRNCQNGNDFIKNLLIGLGRLYEEGLNPLFAELYPKIEFPVSRGTPMISPHIVWNHSQDWLVYDFNYKREIKKAENTYTINVKSDDFEYLSGHVIDGRNLFPATAYLSLVWDLYAFMHGKSFLEWSVVFKNVRFLRATSIPKEGSLNFLVTIQLGRGNFQVVEGGSVIVSGNVSAPKDADLVSTNKVLSPVPVERNPKNPNLTEKDIYKELRLRGYNYKGLFKSLTSVESSGKFGQIKWHGNYVAFMDNMLQAEILNVDSRHLIVPISIDKIVINVKKHATEVNNLKGDENELPVQVFHDVKLIKSGGIVIKGLRGSIIARKKNLFEPVLEKYDFLPYSLLDEEMTLSNAVRICVHLMIENNLSGKLEILEVHHKSYSLVAPLFCDTVGDLPLLQCVTTVLSDDSLPSTSSYTIQKNILPCDKSASLVVITFNEEITQEVLKKAVDSIEENGFVIYREKNCERKCYLDDKLESNKLSLVFETYCEGEKILFLKKTVGHIHSPAIVEITDHDLSWLSELQTVMKECAVKNRLVLLVSQGNPESGLIGFTNCIRKEPGGNIVRCLFIRDETAPKFSIENPFYSSQLRKGLAINVYQNGQWGSYRHLPLNGLKLIKSEFGYVNILNNGDLSTITWLQSPKWKSLEENPFYVYYSSINFKDIMLATGRIPSILPDNIYSFFPMLGFEFSGKLSDGRRLMGICEGGSFSMILDADKLLLWDVPDDWSLEDAATVPVVYSTVIWALFNNGRILPGESILIHAGSGGVGLAAITIALFSGCTVYTTVGSAEKRAFLKRQFPQLTDQHIGCSRDTSFEQLIMRETRGKGVDLVLNSLTGDKIDASIRCLAKGGRYLEIGKYDMENNHLIGLNNFHHMKSFHGVMLDTIFKGSVHEKMKLQKVLSQALKAGAIKPLKRIVYSIDQFEDAFRFMLAGKHTGKVLVKIREEDSNMVYSKHLEKEVKPRFYCKCDKSYIVIGGLGGFGLELTDWLISRGARNIIITSRNGIKTGYQGFRTKIWIKYGVKLEISTLPLASREEVRLLLTKANQLAPVGGIFNLAVVLRDGLFENLKVSDFETSLKPKAFATRLLDEVSRELCPQLEQFVVFSSVSCGRGNAGQTNYGMSNSIMERICEKRRKQNLPGLAVQWGAIGEVGLVADKQEDNVEVVIGGTLQQKIQNCLECMDGFLLSPCAVVSSMVVAEKRIGSEHGSVIETVFYILGITNYKSVSSISTLSELGMDSMMAVEIKQILEQKFEIILTPEEIRVLTVARLLELSSEPDTDNFNKDLDTSDGRPRDRKRKFIQFILKEELAEISVLKLPSLADSSTFEKKPNTLILIPGIEGSPSVFESLAKNLFCSVYCLLYSLKYQSCTVTEIAQALLLEIKKIVQPSDKFSIAGYSFGGLVGLELTCMLEKEGYRGNLIILDASPQYTRNMVKSALFKAEISDEKLQNLILLTIASLLWTSEAEKVLDKLSSISDWNDKINLFLEYSNENQYSKDYQRNYIKSIYGRGKAIVSYEGPPVNSIHSSVNLIRPSENLLPSIQEDYGLSEFCAEPIGVHVLDGDHVSFLEDNKMADIFSLITGIQNTTKF